MADQDTAEALDTTKTDDVAAPDNTASVSAAPIADLGKPEESAVEASAPAPTPDATPAPAEPSASDASTSDGGSSTASDTSAAEAASAPSAAPSDAPQSGDEQPELAQPHPEAEAAVAVAPDAMDELKDAANKAGPALSKLGDFEEEFQQLENEAKARFDFARQKATEFVAALEAIFKRG